MEVLRSVSWIRGIGCAFCAGLGIGGGEHPPRLRPQCHEEFFPNKKRKASVLLTHAGSAQVASWQHAQVEESALPDLSGRRWSYLELLLLERNVRKLG